MGDLFYSQSWVWNELCRDIQTDHLILTTATVVKNSGRGVIQQLYGCGFYLKTLLTHSECH